MGRCKRDQLSVHVSPENVTVRDQRFRFVSSDDAMSVCSVRSVDTPVRNCERARMRTVIGLVACHSKRSQPIRGGAQEAGENSLFCLQLQREAEERTWKYTLQQFFNWLICKNLLFCSIFTETVVVSPISQLKLNINYLTS